MQVLVRDNNVDQALRALKKKMQREGIFREMKMRGHYEKPSEKRAREKAEAVRRARKLARKRAQREPDQLLKGVLHHAAVNLQTPAVTVKQRVVGTLGETLIENDQADGSVGNKRNEEPANAEDQALTR